jgi:hypothetical protein
MRILTLLVCGLAAWAATPLTGTWKLNRQKSSIESSLPSFLHNDVMGFRAGGPVTIEVPPSHFIVVDPYGEKGMYRVDVSADQLTLTVTRVKSFEDQSGKQFHSVLVLEKQ